MASDLGKITVDVQPDDAAFAEMAKSVSDKMAKSIESAAGGAGGQTPSVAAAAAGAAAGSRGASAATTAAATTGAALGGRALASKAGAAAAGSVASSVGASGALGAAAGAIGGPVGIAVGVSLGVMAGSLIAATKAIKSWTTRLSESAIEFSAINGQVLAANIKAQVAQFNRLVTRSSISGGAAARNTELRTQLTNSLAPIGAIFERLRLAIENRLLSVIVAVADKIGALIDALFAFNVGFSGLMSRVFTGLSDLLPTNPLMPQLKAITGFVGEMFGDYTEELRKIRKDIRKFGDDMTSLEINREMMSSLEGLSNNRFRLDTVFGASP